MDSINIFLISILSIIYARLLKSTVNWLKVDGFIIPNNDLKLELFCLVSWVWGMSTLNSMEGIIFSLLAGILFAISWVDFHTFQIPLIFIIVGSVVVIYGVITGEINYKTAIYGVIVGSVIPLLLIWFIFLITKRQGMGYGDIQLGFVLGIWLGPMRMALTLFGASLLSLVVWIILAIINGFDRDRALPFAPYLAIAGLVTFIGSVYFPNIFHYLIIN